MATNAAPSTSPGPDPTPLASIRRMTSHAHYLKVLMKIPSPTSSPQAVVAAATTTTKTWTLTPASRSPALLPMPVTPASSPGCVSPSSLERLCRAVTASSSSPLSFDSDGLTSDSESEDGDDSIHFSPSPSPSPKPTNARSPLGSDDSKGLGLLHPALSSSSSFPVQWSWPCSPSSISNSSSNYAAGHLSHGYLASPSRLGGRQGWIWREPSPEVWSIEEETEEEVRRSEMKVGQSNKNKPIKRVRFVLPDEE